MKKVITVLILVVVLSGCASLTSQYLKEHPNVPQNIADHMRKGLICDGMNREQIEIILRLGSPVNMYADFEDKNIDIFEYRIVEYTSYSYYDTYSSVYLLFKNGNFIREEDARQMEARRRVWVINEYAKDHPDRSILKELMLESKIKIGMNKEEVELSLGKPRDINRTVNAYSVSEQWIYGSLGSARYLYFENGILTTWQD